MFTGSDVHGATLGILGMGASVRPSRAAAPWLRHAGDLSQPQPAGARGRVAAGARWVDKDTLLREADHLVLVLPYSAASHHAIGAPNWRG